MCSNSHFGPCTVVQTAHCSNQCFWNFLPSHCQMHNITRNFIKCSFLINNAHVQYFFAKYSSSILLKIMTAAIAPFYFIELYCMSSIVTTFLNIFSSISSITFFACSIHFTPLYMPEFMISPFPIKIGIEHWWTSLLVFLFHLVFSGKVQSIH